MTRVVVTAKLRDARGHDLVETEPRLIDAGKGEVFAIDGFEVRIAATLDGEHGVWMPGFLAVKVEEAP